MSASPIVQTWSHLLLAASWQAAVLALLVLLCERMHWLRSPRVRHSLWWFVLLAPLALAPARLLLSQHHVVMRIPAPAAVTRVTEAVAAPPPLPLSAPVVPVTPGPSPAPAPPFPWRAVLFAGWLLGCAAMALRLVVGHWRVRRMLHESTPVDTGAARTLLDELCAQSGLRTALRQSATISAAMLCGLRRPTIVVPRQWLTDFALTELRALLAHEVAHLRRRDLLAMLAQRLVEIPLFFHPVVWVAARLLAAAREELCDAWALAQGADPAEYARCLTRVAARAQTRFPLASVGLAEGKSRLRQRVEAILGSGNSGAVSRRLVIAVAAVLAVCAIGLAAVRMVAQPGRARVSSAMVPQNEATVIQSAGPLSAAEAEAALQQLGLDAHRLVYEVPFAHEAHLNVEEYRHGKLVHDEGGSVGGIGVGPGRYTFLFFTRETDEQMTFAYSLLDQNGSVGRYRSSFAVSLRGLKGRGGGGFGVTKLEAGKRTPFWYLAANGPGKPFFSRDPQESMPAVIARNDLVVIAYLTLIRTGEPAPAPRPNPARQTTVDFTVLWEDGRPAVGAQITIGTFDAEETVCTSFATVTAGANGRARWIGEVPGAESTAEVGVIASYADAKTQVRPVRVLPQVFRVLLQVGGHETKTLTLRPWPAEAPSPMGDRATLDLTVLFRDGKPVPGATITLQVQTTMQVFEHGEPAPPTGTRPYDLYWALGKTDQHGKATVTIPPLGPGTPLLAVTYHDPRTGKDLTAKRILALQPGTRTSATITIPSEATPTIRSAPPGNSQPPSRRPPFQELRTTHRS